tara:strand:+ start:58 stop:288 length:231 start_codon:yes stop_codon:yes gene_type:complete
MKNILTLIAVLFLTTPAYAQDLNVTTNIKVEDKSLEVEREKAIREVIKISEGKIANERKACRRELKVLFLAIKSCC